jgi:hypothetical protein
MRIVARTIVPLAVLTALCAAPAGADTLAQKLDRLVAAYPDHLAAHDGAALIWKDGTKTPVVEGAAGRSYDEKLKRPSLADQLEMDYPKGPLARPPGPQDDPGRFRNVAFFDRVYGDCSKGQVEKRLVKVPWPGGGAVKATPVNGVADKLRAISTELDRLPPDLKKYVYPSAGTYNCRVVADTGNRSAHSWGVAIDLNTRFSDYWLWSKGKGYRNRIPPEIVAVFEKHGFIWGGKWGHYDTMHFEYRPELF